MKTAEPFLNLTFGELSIICANQLVPDLGIPLTQIILELILNITMILLKD